MAVSWWQSRGTDFSRWQSRGMHFSIPSSSRDHPAISHCSHLLLKCRVATNISQWLKVHSRWFKNYAFAKKFVLVSFWIDQYCFYCFFTLYYCAIFYINAIRVSNSLDPDQTQHFVGLDLGPNCLLKISADDRWLHVGKELNTVQLVDTTIGLSPWVKSILSGSNFLHLTIFKCWLQQILSQGKPCHALISFFVNICMYTENP